MSGKGWWMRTSSSQTLRRTQVNTYTHTHTPYVLRHCQISYLPLMLVWLAYVFPFCRKPQIQKTHWAFRESGGSLLLCTSHEHAFIINDEWDSVRVGLLAAGHQSAEVIMLSRVAVWLHRHVMFTNCSQQHFLRKVLENRESRVRRSGQKENDKINPTEISSYCRSE